MVSVNLRVLIDILRERLRRHVPVSVHRHTSEDGSQDSGYSTGCADAHSDVDGLSGALHGKYSPILEQN